MPLTKKNFFGSNSRPPFVRLKNIKMPSEYFSFFVEIKLFLCRACGHCSLLSALKRSSTSPASSRSSSFNQHKAVESLLGFAQRERLELIGNRFAAFHGKHRDS